MYYIGIDVGGTNLKAGLVDEAGNIVEVERIPLDYKDPEQFAEVVAGLAKAVSAKGGVALEEIAWVGMGMPGSVDGGNVRYLTNIPMENVPLEELFRKHFDRPLYLGNDADCAAVGEYFSGVGQGTKDFAVVTLGTGVGCGLILGGKLQGGAASSEAGHLVIVHGGEQFVDDLGVLIHIRHEYRFFAVTQPCGIDIEDPADVRDGAVTGYSFALFNLPYIVLG